MMWLLLAFLSAALLGFYDVFKKQSLKDNAVIPVSYTHLDVYKRQVVLYVDTTEVFRSTVDVVLPEENRMINAWTDY